MFVEMYIVCGKCVFCLVGKFYVCINIVIIGVDMVGCFVEYVKVFVDNVWKNFVDMDLVIVFI